MTTTKCTDDGVLGSPWPIPHLGDPPEVPVPPEEESCWICSYHKNMPHNHDHLKARPWPVLRSSQPPLTIPGPDQHRLGPEPHFHQFIGCQRCRDNSGAEADLQGDNLQLPVISLFRLKPSRREIAMCAPQV